MKVINKKRIDDAAEKKALARKRIQDAYMKFKEKDMKRLQSFARVCDTQGRIRQDVVFLKEDDGEILAVFPKTYGIADYDHDTMVCYAHAGQHSICTYDYAAGLKSAKESDYEGLKAELEKVGYVLEVLDKMPEEADLQREYHFMMDSYRKSKRGLNKVQDDLEQIDDARALGRGDEIEYKGKRGIIQYALFHGVNNPVVIRWQNEDGSEEIEVPYSEAQGLKVHDSKVKDSEDSEDVENTAETEAPDAEVVDNCGKKKVKVYKRSKK